jgi:tRNA A37 methylthiotransferase MiaB
VLVDSFEIRNGKTVYSGRTLSNKPANFEAESARVGEFINVKIEKACPFHLIGTAVK